MTQFLVEYDVTEVFEEEYEDDEGNTYYEDREDVFSDELSIDAEDEEDAREQAYDELYSRYDDVYVWSVRSTGLSEED